MEYQKFIHFFVFQAQMISGNIFVCPTYSQYSYLPNYKNRIDLPVFLLLFLNLIFRKHNAEKALLFKPFSHFYLCTLVNRTTLSTWGVRGNRSTPQARRAV